MPRKPGGDFSLKQPGLCSGCDVRGARALLGCADTMKRVDRAGWSCGLLATLMALGWPWAVLGDEPSPHEPLTAV